ncbi:MAG: hypothetical protein ACYCX4_10460 [Bacillota bacterium]
MKTPHPSLGEGHFALFRIIGAQKLYADINTFVKFFPDIGYLCIAVATFDEKAVDLSWICWYDLDASVE